MSLFVGLTEVSASAQGTFQNLDFESAQVIFVPGNPAAIVAADALPDWNVYYGVNQQTQIAYNSFNGGLTLEASNSYVLSGNFSVLFNSLSFSMPISISQTATIPAGTQSLFFEAQDTSTMPLSVSLNGENLSYSVISVSSGYTLYGADISTFAGQTETLTFSASPFVAGGPAGAGWYLDNIQFSSLPVPEPSASFLLLLGSGVLIYGRRNRKYFNV
jgi:PEP-CTERM motif